MICFTVSASLVPLATKGPGCQRQNRRHLPGDFSDGPAVDWWNLHNGRASMWNHKWLNNPHWLTDGFFVCRKCQVPKITSWYTNVHKKWNPEEFQLRNLKGIWGSPCSASKWVFQIFPRGWLYSRKWRHHEWQKMWDFNLIYCNTYWPVSTNFLQTLPAYLGFPEQQFLVSPHSMLSTFTNCSMVRFWYITLKKKKQNE